MDTGRLSRRDFLTRSGKAAGFAALAGTAAFALHEPERHPFRETDEKVVLRDLRVPGYDPGLAIIRGDDPASMTRAAIEALGGIGMFIEKGDHVVVKPNIGWDRKPEQAANTNPEVVAEVVRLCREAGASQITVTDVSCNDPTRCFNRSGIARAAEEAGAEVMLPEDAHYRNVNMGGHVLRTQLVYDVYLEADKFINIPIAKHHTMTRATLGMKNLYGILGGNRSRLHQEIHHSIADLANFLRPTLVVLDAYRMLLRNGPQGGSLDDVDDTRTLIASVDQVAVDAWATEVLFSLTAEDMPCLGYAEAYGLGTADWRSLPLIEETV